MDATVEQIRRLMRQMNQMDGAYYYFSRKLGYKENLLYLLYALDDGCAHSQVEICRDWLIPKTTVNTNVKELVAAGYATLEGSGREKVIALTSKGRDYAEKLLGKLYDAEYAAMAQTLERFSAAFVDALGCYAGILCQELEKHASEGGSASEGKEEEKETI